MHVHKILRGEEWAAFDAAGRFEGSTDDRRDGFIHLSTGEQVDETIARHFAGAVGLWLVTIDAAALGDNLRWETSRGGAVFPHLYRVLERSDVVEIRAL